MPHALTPGPDVLRLFPPAMADYLLQNVQETQARGVVFAALPAYTYANGTITANANAALAAQDGITYQQGDRLLLAAGAAGADNGLYVVVTAGSVSTPWQLMRAPEMQHGKLALTGMSVTVGSEGTRFGGSEWKLFSANVTVGTTAQAWWPQGEGGTIALAAGAATVANLWIRAVQATNGAKIGAVDATAAAAVKATATAGPGTGSIVLAGTTTDTINWSYSNW